MGIQPDWIAVGQVDNVVQISSINYSTNTITLASPISRSDGDPVWLYRDSSGRRVLYGSAPDVGAHEYQGASTPTCENLVCDPGECSSCPQECSLSDCDSNGQCDTGLLDGSENCETDPSDCSCTSPQTCCSGACLTPACSQASDCGSDPCRTYTCSSPGTCSASCSYIETTACLNGDGCCPSGCSESTDNDCGSSPVALYHFDEGSGTTAGDSSGNNDGTIYGATWSTGKIGTHSLFFNGIDNYVGMGDNPNLDMGTSDFTLAAWVNLDSSSTTAYSTIIGKGGTADSNPGYWLFYHNANQNIDFRMGEGISRVRAYGSTDIKDSSWHHIAVTADRDGLATIYVDGYPDGSASISSKDGLSLDTTSGFSIGSGYWYGNIDEVRVYTRVLTPQEILGLVNQNSHPADTSPNDGCISNSELLAYIALWYQNSTANPMSELMSGIALWKLGTGCP
jgi:hypothetical protein